MDEPVDRNAPATKGDLLDLREATKRDLLDPREETKGDLQHLREETTGDLQRLREDLLEGMRDMQTEMLKAFYSFAQTTDLKLKEGEVADFGLRQRMSVIESRVTEIERRLNLPPAA